MYSLGLTVQCKQEKYGASHQLNWKKTGLSRARFADREVSADTMPTARCKAAFQYLCEKNPFYANLLKEQQQRRATKASMSISSYDLFIVYAGIETAIYPELYPSVEFTDTGIRSVQAAGRGED